MKNLCLVLLLLPVVALAGGQVVLAPVNVISMNDGSIRPDQAIVIRADRIVSIVPVDQAPTATGGDGLIDGRGAWVIPGLAEMHAHVPSGRRGEQYARDMMGLFLANGITTIRGMLGEPWHLVLREILHKQTWPGPRLLTSGPSFNGNSVTSPGQAAGKARAQASAGYDFLKLHPGLEPDEYQAIVETAREIGIPFAGHVSFAVGLDAALHARQDTIDHLDGYAEQMVAEDSGLAGVAPSWFGLNLALGMDPGEASRLAMATTLAGVWNVPTQSLFETTAGNMPVEELLARPGMDLVSDSLRANWTDRLKGIREQSSAEQRRAFLTARRSLIFELQDAGAGLLLGSDAPQIMNVPGYSVHQELEYMTDAGLTPLQALQSGTINVAKFFGFWDQGEVSEGFIADFILLEDSPLERIRATTGILGVMRAGTWYDREALDRMLDSVRQRGI